MHQKRVASTPRNLSSSCETENLLPTDILVLCSGKAARPGPGGTLHISVLAPTSTVRPPSNSGPSPRLQLQSLRCTDYRMGPHCSQRNRLQCSSNRPVDRYFPEVALRNTSVPFLIMSSLFRSLCERGGGGSQTLSHAGVVRVCEAALLGTGPFFPPAPPVSPNRDRAWWCRCCCCCWPCSSWPMMLGKELLNLLHLHLPPRALSSSQLRLLRPVPAVGRSTVPRPSRKPAGRGGAARPGARAAPAPGRTRRAGGRPAPCFSQTSAGPRRARPGRGG